MVIGRGRRRGHPNQHLYYYLEKRTEKKYGEKKYIKKNTGKEYG
jgi:hypothetical protein